MTHRIHRTAVAVLAIALFLGAVLPTGAAEAKGVVNINKANAEQLALLPRIGPAIAQRILEFRQANGPFKSVEDLMLVRGIGERTFELLKPYVTVSGDTTLTEKVRVPRRPAETSE